MTQTNSIPRILLVTSNPPGGPTVGGVFLETLLRAYPHGKIACFCLPTIDKRHWKLPPHLAHIPFEAITPPRQKGLGIRGLRAITTQLVQIWNKTWGGQKLAKKIALFGQKHHVDVVWVVLSEPPLIHAARRIAKYLNAELIPTVWDPLESIIPTYRLDKKSSRWLQKEFDAILQQSRRCGVASITMSEEYASHYSTTAIPLIHSPANDLHQQPAIGIKSDDRLIIGVAGSVYARKEWYALLDALISCNWIIAGHHITIRVLSSILHPAEHRPVHIEYLGWRSVEETVTFLAQTDIGYVPYWMDDVHQEAVRVCFPNKIPTYLAAGIPIFYHGPAKSSPTRFLETYPCGISCHSLEAQTIITTLEAFITNKLDYSHEVMRARQEMLSETIFQSEFLRLMEIKHDELAN